MLLSAAQTFHPGELHVQSLMRVPDRESSPTSPFLTPGAGFMLQRAPLLSVGAVDAQGRPWATLWGSGDSPMAQVLGENVVGVKATVDARYDPVVEALMQGRDDKGVVKLDVDVNSDGSGDDSAGLANALSGTNASDVEVRRISGLTLDLETRKRVKLAGRMMVGIMEGNETVNGGAQGAKNPELTLVTKIDESLGNCPKYLNKKHIVTAESNPKLLSDSIQLPEEAVSLLSKSDLLFVSSSHQKGTMDLNLRGGPTGFCRLISNDATGAVLAWPEYSGNRLYQTLGNFVTTPLAGIVIPDFETGDVLYATGVPEILSGQDAAALLPRSNLVVTIKITGARFVQNGLPFRGEPGEASPYNPPVRYAPSEKASVGATLLAQQQKNTPENHAILVSKTDLTPTIARFRFRIENPAAAGSWKPGQYATLSFANELDLGYSHMRDDDPRSLNDDYIRTFTVSNAPSKDDSSSSSASADHEFELTVRKVGSATRLMFRQSPRTGFELPLKGFEGEFIFERKEGKKNTDGTTAAVVPVVAAGIGITPVLGQLGYIDLAQLRLLWSTSLADIGLVADTFERHPDLVQATTLFVTGKEEDKDNSSVAGQKQKELLEQVRKTGVALHRRRVEKADVDQVNALPGVDEWYMCVGPSLKTSVLAWLAGRRVVYEDFDY